MEHFEFMDTILTELADERAMMADFDEADPYEGMDSEDDDWEEPDWDAEIGYNPYMGCYDFDC